MKKCAYADRYRGLRAPKCNGGDPCDACLDKYQATQSRIDAAAEAFVAGAIIGGLSELG